MSKKTLEKVKNQIFRKYKRWDCIEQRREENKNKKVYNRDKKKKDNTVGRGSIKNPSWHIKHWAWHVKLTQNFTKMITSITFKQV